MSGEVDKTLDTSALDFGTTELLSGLLSATLLKDGRDPCMLPLSARADILSKVLLTFSSCNDGHKIIEPGKRDVKQL